MAIQPYCVTLHPVETRPAWLSYGEVTACGDFLAVRRRLMALRIMKSFEVLS